MISGISKGHRLKAPKGIDVRPTEDKIKESLFNILGYIAEKSIVLDLFAGSGSIGIEFLSRGAKKCYFVDSSKYSISIIKENLKHSKLIEKSRVMQRDSSKAINFFKNNQILFDYIYLDPPFDKHNLLYTSIDKINDNSLLKAEGLLIIEHGKEVELKQEISGLEKIDFRKYGSKCLTFYKKSI